MIRLDLPAAQLLLLFRSVPHTGKWQNLNCLRSGITYHLAYHLRAFHRKVSIN
jgi:hypothetical protein